MDMKMQSHHSFTHRNNKKKHLSLKCQETNIKKLENELALGNDGKVNYGCML